MTLKIVVLQAFPYLYIPIDSGLPETTAEGASSHCLLRDGRLSFHLAHRQTCGSLRQSVSWFGPSNISVKVRPVNASDLDSRV